MRNHQMFQIDQDPIDSNEWSESTFDIDDEAFAQAIAAGRHDQQAA